jgi:MoxR-like ATPase
MDITSVQRSVGRIIGQLERAVIGKRAVLEKILMAVISGGHVLIEDVPGLAKTLIARSIADALRLDFSRIQFTPDLLPGDITGATIYNQAESSFEFRRGPLFANLILADEINRASPKTQSALLEAMQEQHVTIGRTQHRLDAPFLVIATQNPIELEGTYPLPEAQLDRFIMRVEVGYPEEEAEVRMLLNRRDRRDDEVVIEPIVSAEELLQMQAALETVYVDEQVSRYIAAIVRATRTDSRVAVGASPRGTLALFKLARAAAVLDERDYVTPEDVKTIATEALAHRIILKPEMWARQIREEKVVGDLLRKVPVPAPVDQR